MPSSARLWRKPKHAAEAKKTAPGRSQGETKHETTPLGGPADAGGHHGDGAVSPSSRPTSSGESSSHVFTRELKRYNVMGVRFDVDVRYNVLDVVGQGAYGVVCAAHDEERDESVAIKKIFNPFEHVTCAKRTLREIRLLRLLQHDNVIRLRTLLPPVRADGFKDLYIILDLMETDLASVIKSPQPLTDDHVQFFLYQVLRGVKFLHTASPAVTHRDLKPRNLLVNSNCDLKICDFGLARVDVFDLGLSSSSSLHGAGSLMHPPTSGGGPSAAAAASAGSTTRSAGAATSSYNVPPGSHATSNNGTRAASSTAANHHHHHHQTGAAASSSTTTTTTTTTTQGGPAGAGASNQSSTKVVRAMTDYVATRWYRAPEIITGCVEYTKAVDMWAVGCILAELLGRKPLWPGSDSKHQLGLICQCIGKPDRDTVARIRQPEIRAFVESLPDCFQNQTTTTTHSSRRDDDDDLDEDAKKCAKTTASSSLAAAFTSTTSLFRDAAASQGDASSSRGGRLQRHSVNRGSSSSSSSSSGSRASRHHSRGGARASTATVASFRELYPDASPRACALLDRLLVFDPAYRADVEAALDDPYLDQLHYPDDEPRGPDIPLDAFEFETHNLGVDELRDEIAREIAFFHRENRIPAPGASSRGMFGGTTHDGHAASSSSSSLLPWGRASEDDAAAAEPPVAMMDDDDDDDDRHHVVSRRSDDSRRA